MKINRNDIEVDLTLYSRYFIFYYLLEDYKMLRRKPNEQNIEYAYNFLNSHLCFNNTDTFNKDFVKYQNYYDDNIKIDYGNSGYVLDIAKKSLDAGNIFMKELI